jgi:hypothetical protein
VRGSDVVPSAYLHSSKPPEAKSGSQIWTYNFPETPLEISSDTDRAYELKNVTVADITSFQLGCVSRSDEAPEIVYQMAPRTSAIAPGEGWFSFGSHTNPDGAACERRNGRLAVIEARFSGGKTWRPLERITKSKD